MAEKKIGGIINVTNEMLESMFGLPEDVRIVEVASHIERDITMFKMVGQEKHKQLTWEIGEGMDYPRTSAEEYILKAQLKRMRNLQKVLVENGTLGDKLRRLLEEIEEEEKNVELRKQEG